jgi:hypothetical protein
MVEEAGLGELGEVARVSGAFACGGNLTVLSLLHGRLTTVLQEEICIGREVD